ncbi:MAG: radical SAM protein [Atopobiaceae bacterium]|nr:radical SAM protein [Atopobiaceae bacterium]
MFDLNSFVDNGVSDIVETIGRFYLGSPKGVGFLTRFGLSARRAMKVRADFEKQGTHVPAFLIASIASECNLSCAGCYARANSTVGADARAHELSDGQWAAIFEEAAQIGVSFILLAGGEPTLRRGVLEAAAQVRDIVFPVFTNGVFDDPSYIDFFDEHRTMVPVFSIEGDAEQTDARRGAGVAAKVEANMAGMAARGILWGASITVTNGNLDTVTDAAFISDLKDKGCGLVVFVEYVPVKAGTRTMALDKAGQERLMERIDALNGEKDFKGIILIAFPGSEDAMGGCLAAGRGFFHISQAGAAEPCPFSPFSVANVADEGLLAVIESPFFKKVQEVEAAHASEHAGGCTLFQHQDEVRRALAAAQAELSR